jgi:hypothetical protein
MTNAYPADRPPSIARGPLLGRHITLNSTIGALQRCRYCDNAEAIVEPGAGPHCLQLRCSACRKHLSWVAAWLAKFLTEKFCASAAGVAVDALSLTDAEHERIRHMRIDQVFETSSSKYLKAADLNGREVTVRIAGVQIEQFGKENERKPVISFDGKSKGLPLNKTNARAIAAMFGNETENWIHSEITLFPTKTDFGGELVDCIRIKAAVKSRAPARADMDDEIPF